MQRDIGPIENPEQFGFGGVQPFQEAVERGKAGAPAEDALKAGAQFATAARGEVAAIRLEIGIELPDQRPHPLLRDTVPIGEGICVTRRRLDAALYEPAPPRRPGTAGRPPTKGRRLPNLADVLTAAAPRWQRVRVPGWYGESDRLIEFCSATALWRHAGLPVVPLRWVLLRDPLGRFDPQALLCTDPARQPLQILTWYVRRWQVEVTSREVRDPLELETRRQWSDLAITRITPCLLALFSLVTPLAARLDPKARRAVATAAWYRKPHPTFADTLAAVRRQFRREQGLFTSHSAAEEQKPRPMLHEAIADALCQAA